MKKNVLLILLMSVLRVFAQGDSTSVISDTTNTQNNKEHKAKTGFSFGALPVVAYDSDIGFKYGALANVYYFGDGSTYPKYLHSLYMEWSRTTKGSGINQIIYDTDYLIPKTKMTLEASYFTEKALGFYGFNGYESNYNPDFADDSSIDYNTRMYYKHEREQLRLKANFQRYVWEKKLRLLFGYAYYDTHVGRVDIDNLNEGKSDGDLLPDTATLYDKYVDWDIIKKEEKTGGQTNMFKFGLVYDTRDQEGNPMTGIWSEALILYAPSFGVESSYTKLALTHRQYFTLKKELLNLAYRVSYQPKIAGDIPFYMLPFVYDSKQNRDGLGGAKTLRGILLNRIVGDDLLFANLEIRWKFYRGLIKNQNIYLAINTFVDAGMVTKEYAVNKSNIPQQAMLQDFTATKETIHGSYGAGLNVVINHNFVISVNYGRSINPQDGKDGLYIGLNFLF